MPANTNSQQQQQQTMKKKLNKDRQHIRKRRGEHFKKKYRQMKRISDQTDDQLSQSSEMIQLVEDRTLSMSSLSSLFMKKKCYPWYTESNTDPTLFLSNFSMISSQTFKEMLLKLVTSKMERNLFDKLLDTEEILAFIRQLTQLMNTLNYLQLQDEQWTYYYNLGINEGIWTGSVSKNMAIVNSMCYTYGRSKIIIEQRSKKYKKNLNKIQIDIDEHMKQIPSFIDSNKLLAIVTDLIYKDQYRLHIELERRRGMLKFDAKDHQLVHTFYNLKPRQTEIHSAKVIWKAINDEQILRYEIALFKTWLSSSKSSPSIPCTFGDLALTKINDIITQLIFDKQLSSSTTVHLTNNQTNSIDQFIEDLSQQTIAKAETIAEHYVQKVKDEKTKILNNQEKFKKPPTVITIITAIKHRQTNMIQRAQYHIEQTLKSIFHNKYTR